MLHPGEELGGFVVEGLLGEGSNSCVYRLRSRSDGVTCALKLASSDLPAVEARLRREAELHGRVSHPNVVPLLQTLQLGEHVGILLQLVEGPTLGALLQRGTIAPEHVPAIGEAIIAAVGATHSAGVIHRDIKPSNILMRADGKGGWTPMLCDFGLARAADVSEPRADRESLYGTPAYMAPEIIRGARMIDPRADLFSLGAVLYELTTGRPTFRADSERLFQDITDGRFDRPTRWGPMPTHMEVAIVGALQPELRWRVPDTDTLLALWRGENPRYAYALPPGSLGSRSGPLRAYQHPDPTIIPDEGEDTGNWLLPARPVLAAEPVDEVEAPPVVPPQVSPPPPAPSRTWMAALPLLLLVLLGGGAWAAGLFRSDDGAPSTSAPVAPPTSVAPQPVAAPPVAPVTEAVAAPSEPTPPPVATTPAPAPKPAAARPAASAAAAPKPAAQAAPKAAAPKSAAAATPTPAAAPAPSAPAAPAAPAPAAPKSAAPATSSDLKNPFGG